MIGRIFASFLRKRRARNHPRVKIYILLNGKTGVI